MLRFLYERMGRVQVRLVLRLFCALDFAGGTVATLSDERLEVDGVINQQRNLVRELADTDFCALVTVTRGTPDTAGRKGITSSYDLAPLLREFRRWRAAGSRDVRDVSPKCPGDLWTFSGTEATPDMELGAVRVVPAVPVRSLTGH